MSSLFKLKLSWLEMLVFTWSFSTRSTRPLPLEILTDSSPWETSISFRLDVALRDALLGVRIPFYEVHISDIKTREDFRQKSYFSDIAIKVFSGHGTNGYSLALKEALKIS